MRIAQRAERAVCLPRSDEDRTPRMRDHRAEHRALVALGQLLELGARIPRVLDLAGGECDLDVRGKQCGAFERLLGLCARPADRGERGVVLPLSEPKLREAGLRLPAQIARLAVRLLRFLEPAEQPEHLALTVVREPVTTLSGSKRVPASRASSSASSQEPSSCRSSERWMRKRPVNATRPGCRAAHEVSARVHSLARPTSNTAWQARMTPQ